MSTSEDIGEKDCPTFIRSCKYIDCFNQPKLTLQYLAE